MFGIEGRKASKGRPAVSTGPLPTGAQYEEGECWEGYCYTSGENVCGDWQEIVLRKKMPFLAMMR